jgi:hypothetical protein
MLFDKNALWGDLNVQKREWHVKGKKYEASPLSFFISLRTNVPKYLQRPKISLHERLHLFSSFLLSGFNAGVASLRSSLTRNVYSTYNPSRSGEVICNQVFSDVRPEDWGLSNGQSFSRISGLCQARWLDL